MSVAKDRPWFAARRLIRVGLTLALCAVEIGCARMRGVRNDEAPVLPLASAVPESAAPTTAAPESTVASAAPAPVRNDPYADWLEGRMRPTPAQSSLTTAYVRTTSAPAGAYDATKPVAVSLQPPTELRPRTATPNSSGPMPSDPEPARPAGSVALAVTTPMPAPALTPPSAAVPAAPKDSLGEFRSVVAAARAKLDGMKTYQVHLTRQERVGNVLQPAEDILLSIRRDPVSVRLEWTQGPNQGREVLYSAGGPMYIRMPNPVMPRITMAPDSPLALKNSRHPIGEAGFDSILARLEDTLRKHDPGLDGGRLAYVGIESPQPDGPACHKLLRVTSNGETCIVYIDQKTELPCLIQETAANGNLLERYVFRDIRSNPSDLASANAFDPDARWGPARGLLGRLVRSADAASSGRPPATSSLR